MNKKTFAGMSALLSVFVISMGVNIAQADQKALPKSASPDGAKVYILSPKNGAAVKSPVTVVFGLSGMGVAPAGIEKEHTGHHHLLVDVDTLPALHKPIPADKHHIHFGGGQTEVSIELAKGKHSLQLLLGDHLHIPHNPAVVSEKVSITVE